MPCQTRFMLFSVKCSSTLFLYLAFSCLITLLSSLFTPFNSSTPPLPNIHFFRFLVIHGLLLAYTLMCFTGMDISVQKVTYALIVSVSSSKLEAASINMSQSVHSSEPCSSFTESSFHSRVAIIFGFCRCTRGRYVGNILTRLWSALPSFGSWIDVYASLTLEYNMSRVTFSRVAQVTCW